MSKNILQALGKIDVALGGNADDAVNVIDALDQISERAGSLKDSLAGSLTLGKGTADEVTITAAQLKALLKTLSS